MMLSLGDDATLSDNASKPSAHLFAPRPSSVIDVASGDLDVAATLSPPTWHDPIVAEGYLKKIRGFGQNRKRFFRLTAFHLAFYARDCGELISYVKRSDLIDISDISGERFELVTQCPFGASGSSRMLLEASDPVVKTRWLNALRRPMADLRKEEVVIVEGYLKKIQPITNGFSRTRWFMLTTRALTYYEHEAGERMAYCDVENIDRVMEVDDDTFVIHGKTNFSRSGGSTITLRAEDALVKEKWLTKLRSIGGFRTSGLTPLPADLRPVSDHYGGLARRRPEDPVEDSEGNRFIRNGDL